MNDLDKYLRDRMAQTEKLAILATAPLDYELWDQATAAKGHISMKAVQDEYDRLLLAKLYRPRRTLWAKFWNWFLG